MPAAAAVAAVVVSALAATGSAIEANQQTQHAKGAAQAQQTLMNDQIAKADATTKADQSAKASSGSATQAAALAALRASMTANSGMGGSLLTNPTGSGVAPTAGKMLLGA